MTGETQHAYAISSTESGPKHTEKEFSLELFVGKDGRDMDRRLSDNSDLYSRGCNNSGPQFGFKDKEPQNQREAVIRPQQAGKIDFKSLYNRPKFSSDGLWNSGKSGPQSPNGKSRAREKAKRSGKGDRVQHQLYRLSINNSRPNPTIGIAYPQQKVTPPKKLEVNNGPISGNYRFPVPGIPERETELQQDDLSFHRCFQEVSSSLTSTNSTSQTKAATRQHHSLKLQQPTDIDHEGSNTNEQLHFLDFQATGTDSWHSPEKNFTCATYGVPVQKAGPFSEVNKSSQHSFGSVPYQYSFQSLHDANPDAFCSEATGQDYLDEALASNHAVQGGFAFHSSSVDGLETSVNGAYDNLLKDNRTYGLPSQQTPFFHTEQAPGAQHPPPPPCYKGRNEHSTDLNGAISSSGAITSSGAIDQTISNFQDSKTVFSSSNFSLHNNSITTPANNRQPTSKDTLPSQIPPLRRNISPNSIPQVPFQSKGYSSSSVNIANAGPVPFDKSSLPTAQNHTHMWDGQTSAYPSIDQNTVPYPTPSGSQFTYQCQSNVEQRHMLKSSRMSWQQGHLPTVMPNQNRIELSRQLGTAESAFPCNNADWRGGNHMQNNYTLNKATGYHSSEPRPGEEVANQSKDTAVQNCGSNNNIYFQDSVKDASSPVCDPRNKNLLFSMNQSVGPARNASNQTAALPLSTLVTASPSESPLSSPVPNTLSSSTCSSLSPMSSSPINPGSEESQHSSALTPTSFYNQSCHPKENKAFLSVDPLHPSSLPYHQTDSTKTFSFPSEVTKDEPVSKYLQEKRFHRQNNEAGNGCINNFENEPPPPPYSSHHLLANSLSSASLDQLDVLLTCKQCDQNYSNLSSFLEHRQYCGLHAIFQSEVKESSRESESRKVGVSSLKPSRPVPGLPLPKGSSDVPLHVQASNKCGDFLLEGVGKGDTKEEPLKANLFNGSTANLSSVNASDLEIDEAKLDSLITEALNGLGYQSDNPEIDSSFMDAFVDEELSMIKAQPYKIKDILPNEGTFKVKELVEQQGYRTKNVFCVENNNRTNHPENNKSSGRRHGETKGVATKFIDTGTRQLQPMNVEDGIKGQKIGDALCEKKEFDTRVKPKITGKPNNHLPVSVTSNPFEMGNLAKKQPNRRCVGSCQKGKVDQSRTEENRKPQRARVRDKKKRKPGTWSKELIQKIVQQKNKLNKLHVKSDRSTQEQSVTETPLQARQSLSFGEYDYVSDSDDDVEYGKKHIKNQPKGALKYTFTSKHCGLIERTKEVTAWKCSKTKEIQNHSRDSDNETAGKESYPLRVRRRSSRSSSSSVSSEIDRNCKSAEMTDSENEKEVECKRKYFHKSNRKTLQDANATALPTTDFSKENHSHQSDFSRGAKKFGSAKFLLAGSKVYQGKISIIQTSSLNENTESPATQKQFPIGGPTSNHTDTRLCQNKSSDKDRVATSYTGIESEYQSDLTMTHQNGTHQFPAYSENASNYHSEELTKSLHVANTMSNAVHVHSTETGMSYSKELGLCDGPKDFGYYNQNPHSVDFAITTKVCSSYSKSNDVYEQKDVPHYYDSHLFAKPLAAETNSCSSDINTSSYEHNIQDMASFKAETAQKKVGSPLNFDSVSVFGDLPVSEFDSTLYTNVSITKDNFVPYTGEANQCSKTTLFDHQFAPFLAEKDWELMQEMSPLLSQDNFHNSEIKEHDDIRSVPSGQIASETIASSHVAFMSNMSIDELEIKRLVTELESQLQTNKPNTQVLQSNSEHVKSQTFSKDSSQYSTSPSNHLSENAKSLFFSEELNDLSNTCQAQTMAFVGSNSEANATPHSTVNECYETPKNSWSYSVPFDSIEQPTHQSIFKGSDSLDTYVSNEEMNPCTDTLKNASVSQMNMSKVTSYESPNVLCDVGSSSLSDEDCVQNGIALSVKCPKVTASEPSVPNNTADSQSKQEEALQPLCNEQTKNGLHEQNKLDESFDDPPKLEHFQSHASNFQSEFELQEKAVPLPNLTSTSHTHFTDSEVELSRTLSHKTLQAPAASNSEESSLVNEDRQHADSLFPTVYADGDDSRPLLFDIPNLDKEEISCANSVVTQQGSAVNPLQQLQLFVARTAKTNEEEMLMPCFPGLLSNAHSISSDDGVHSAESDGNSSFEREIPSGSPAHHQPEGSSAFSIDAGASVGFSSLTPELREGEKTSELADDRSLTKANSCSANSPKPANSELQSCKAQQHHLRDEYSELDDLNSSTGAISQNHDSLLSFRDATQNPLTEEVKKEDQIVNLLEADENQAALTFQEHRDAAFSNQVSYEIEPLDSVLKPASYMCDTERNLPCNNLSHDGSLSYASHLDCSSTQTELNNGREEEWPQFQCPSPGEPHNSCILLVNEKGDNLLLEPSIYSEHTKMSKKDNTQFSEILSTSYCNDKSSNSLHEESPISHAQLAKSHQESSSISDLQMLLSEKPAYDASQNPNSNSELLVTLTQTSFDEAPSQDTDLFPLTPPEYNSTVPGVNTSIGTCLADNLLNNIEQSEQGLLLRSHPPLCASDNGQLKSEAQFNLSSFTHSFPPSSDQEELTEMLTKCVNNDPTLPHHKENEACSSTGRDPNLQLMCMDVMQVCHSSPDNSAYSTLSVDLFTEMNDTDNESRACHQPKTQPDGPNKECQHTSQDTLNCASYSKEKPNYLRKDLPSTTEADHVDRNDTRMSEAIGKSPIESSSVVENFDNPMKTSVLGVCVPEHLDPVMNGVLNILNCEKSKAIFRSLGLPSGSGDHKDRKAAGLQVTCDICSASFRSKPGLTRHKACKHQIKYDGEKVTTATDDCDLVFPRKACKTSRTNSYKILKPKSVQNVSANPPTETNAKKLEEQTEDLADNCSIDFKANSEPTLKNTLSAEQSYDSRIEETTNKQLQEKGEKKCWKQNKEIDPNENSKKTELGKVKKRKVKAYVGTSTDSHAPSDEILNIIKTNILKAITCPKPSSSIVSTQAKNGSCESQQSCNADEAGDSNCKLNNNGRIMKTKKFSGQEFDGSEQGHKEEKENLIRESPLCDQGWIDGYLRHVEQNVSDESEKEQKTVVSLEENQTLFNGEMEVRKGDHNGSLEYGPSSPLEIQRTLRLIEAEMGTEARPEESPKNLFVGTCFSAESNLGQMEHSEPLSKSAEESDIHSLFDDDITFSMLFPRDDHFIRRKCTRVYGKRNKNLTPAASVGEADSTGILTIEPAPSFVSESTDSMNCSKADPSRYETISINDSLMLDICHRGKSNENDVDSNSCETIMLQTHHDRQSPGMDSIDMDSETLLNFLCQNHQTESTAPLNALPSVSDRLAECRGSFLTKDQFIKSSSETEDGHFFRECDPEELNKDGSEKGRSPPQFHTIDMELLNAKLETRGIHFLEGSGETSDDLDINSGSPKENTNQSHAQGHNIGEEGKTTKIRSDVNLKTKNKQYKCKACFQWFRTLGELNHHKFSHNPCPPPTCYMCVQRKFSSREQLKDHLREKHAKNKAGFWVCGMCLKEISDVWMYNEHLREHATQFARKGQAQSVLGLHGCFADEAAVHTFLTRFIYRKPNKSDKQSDSGNTLKTSDPEEPVEHESKTSEEAEVNSTQSKLSPSNFIESTSPPPEHVQQKEAAEKNNSLVQPNLNESPSPLPEFPSRNDAGQKNTPIHPHCKDPSRDCHHCGKQFPKPFKLQRHLVVHSLQKIFLCHRCPEFYQDVQELRNHLRQQHKISEDSDIKHTTLYACEMCADVMHVIKKSFICSTCNYTFSKKEQYDRHMEKHLVGGSKTFRFRRVRRPDPTGNEASEKLKEADPSNGSPPNKKRRNMPGLSSVHQSYISSPNLVHANHTSDGSSCIESIKAPQLFIADADCGMSETLVKMEDEAEDFGNPLPEMEGPMQLSSMPPCLSPPMPRDLKRDPELDDIPTLSINEPSNQDVDMKPPPPFPDSLEIRGDPDSVYEPTEGGLPEVCTEQPAHIEEEECLPLENLGGKCFPHGEMQSLQDKSKEEFFQCTGKKSTELTEVIEHRLKTNEFQKVLCINTQANDLTNEEVSLKASATEILPHVPMPMKEKAALSVSSTASRINVSVKKGSPETQQSNRQHLSTQSIVSIDYSSKLTSSKEKATPDTMLSTREGSANMMKEVGGSHHKTPNSQAKIPSVINTVKRSSSSPGKSLLKPLLNNSLKTYPKKRKDHLTLGYKCSSNTRENLDGEEKMKNNKVVVVGPCRNNCPGTLKKHDRTHAFPAMSSGREDTCSKGIRYHKPKAGGVGSQIKKLVQDNHNQKKVEGRHHSNGANKSKKDLLGKTLHQLLPKGPGPTLHKHKLAQAFVKPTECPNYRTAESQNTLLSKLFGQKLTSFKIPLRRDTSE